MSKPVPAGKCRDTEKVRFYVKREAETYAERKSAEHGHPQYVYQCGMHFHLTKSRPR